MFARVQLGDRIFLIPMDQVETSLCCLLINDDIDPDEFLDLFRELTEKKRRKEEC